MRKSGTRPIEELAAADMFVQALVQRADKLDGQYPLWHGWAITDAFLAGIDYARAVADQRQPETKP